MDNIFDLIIGFIIVYSLLSPLFKKKKKDEPVIIEPYPDEDKTIYYDDEQSIADEIGAMFGNKPAKPKVEQSSATTYSPENYSVTHQQKKHEKKRYSEDEKISSHVEKIKRVISADEQQRVNELADKFLSHQNVPGHEVETNEKRDKIRSIFHSSENLKDYILFAEIFGKPKALRR